MLFTEANYCRAVRCKKQLWLDKNYPDEYLAPASFGNNEELRTLAAGLFGKCSCVSSEKSTAIRLRETKTLVNGGTDVIAGGTFSYGNGLCTADLLKRCGNGFELFLVKSATHIRDSYINAVSFQLFVLHGAGINVTDAYIIHVNGGYIRYGALETESFLCAENVTEKAKELQSLVKKTINDADIYVMNPSEPVERLCEYCFEPYECGYLKHCTRRLPQPNVFDVTRMELREKLSEYDKGNVSFSDLLNNGAALNETQLLQTESEVYGLPPHIEHEKIAEFISGITYPVCFLDFETYQQSVPLYDGIRPLMQIPFQYSLHYIRRKNGKLHHREYIASPDTDVRRGVAEQLCADIPAGACVTAYNMGFEKARIKELAEFFPDLSDKLLAICANMHDLMIPFLQRWYYDRRMYGSYSIKHVLPAICPDDPELDYNYLDGVHNGNEAAAAFTAMAKMSAKDAARIRKELLAYCRLDTLALVKVWEKLKKISRQEKRL